MKKNVFEKHPKLTLTGVLLFLSVISIVSLEWAAGFFFGLGNPVIYESHPVYGYRPEPNQMVSRKKHDMVQINNLGLRATKDWDQSNTKHKILFLGDSVTYGGSYITNEQLFSTLAVEWLPGYESGNAGVNGWGVNNVCALVTEMNFLPADIYVSVFPEGDFYRGLSRIGGQPFWTTKPRYALEELFHYFMYKIQLRQMPPTHFYRLNSQDKAHIASIAVRNLKSMDDFLRRHGKTHLIYISPSRSEMLELQTEDMALKRLFKDYDLKVSYLKDRIGNQTPDVKVFFHDEIHLSVEGHQQWAKMIEPDLKRVILAQEQFTHENENT